VASTFNEKDENTNNSSSLVKSRTTFTGEKYYINMSLNHKLFWMANLSFYENSATGNVEVKKDILKLQLS